MLQINLDIMSWLSWDPCLGRQAEGTNERIHQSEARFFSAAVERSVLLCIANGADT